MVYLGQEQGWSRFGVSRLQQIAASEYEKHLRDGVEEQEVKHVLVAVGLRGQDHPHERGTHNVQGMVKKDAEMGALVEGPCDATVEEVEEVRDGVRERHVAPGLDLAPVGEEEDERQGLWWNVKRCLRRAWAARGGGEGGGWGRGRGRGDRCRWRWRWAVTSRRRV